MKEIRSRLQGSRKKSLLTESPQQNSGGLMATAAHYGSETVLRVRVHVSVCPHKRMRLANGKRAKSL